MIVVDTSVWIAARRQSQVARVLGELIETDDVALAMPVKLELLSGVPGPDRKAFKKRFGALPHLYPDDQTWPRLARWVEEAADAGERFTISDLLIASMTAEIGGLIWSLDKDFARMERLKFVSLYELPH